MSLNNDSNISLEIHKKPNILYDEVDLISSNRRMAKAMETTNTVEISSTDNSSQKSEKSSPDLVYGASIDMHNPRNLGLVKAFLYIKGFPLIVIGPDCKHNIMIINNFII